MDRTALVEAKRRTQATYERVESRRLQAELRASLRVTCAHCGQDDLDVSARRYFFVDGWRRLEARAYDARCEAMDALDAFDDANEPAPVGGRVIAGFFVSEDELADGVVR